MKHRFHFQGSNMVKRSTCYIDRNSSPRPAAVARARAIRARSQHAPLSPASGSRASWRLPDPPPHHLPGTDVAEREHPTATVSARSQAFRERD